MKKLVLMTVAVMALLVTSCGQKTASSENKNGDETTFAEDQPLQSGTYDASYFDISGPDARKGPFDGRILVSLSPDISALYVYEDGNRVKIDYLIMLEKPFEKGDSGIYKALDKEGKPVIIKEDSVPTLTFEKKDSKISIQFDKTPKSTQPAIDVLQRIDELKKK